MADTNFLGEGRELIVNKSSLIGTIGVEAEPTVKFLQIASVMSKDTFYAGVPGHYFVFAPPLHVCTSVHISDGQPMRAYFKEAGDAVIVAFKLSPSNVYLYGITVEKLIEWKPPAKATDSIVEEGLLQTWKATHDDITSLVALQNTETHKLKDLIDKLISHVPTFQQHKVRSGLDALKWCKKTFESNVKAVVDMSELEERKRAKEKSTTARDPVAVESAAGGAAAKDLWALRKLCMLDHGQYYEDCFRERIIIIETEIATKQPNEATIATMRISLGCVLLDPRDQLTSCAHARLCARCARAHLTCNIVCYLVCSG